MTWTGVPWAVKGATHPAEILRLLAYAGTGGKEGIVGPTDLKVVPLTPAGAGVQVQVGAMLALNRATSGDQQTYAAKNPTSDTAPVTATGSGSGRRDLVVAMIEDPNMPGNAAYAANVTDPATGPYVFTRIISNVPAGTTTLQQVPGYERATGVALARLDIPANTATITAAMITDLRKIANPRTERQIIKGVLDAVTTTIRNGLWDPFPRNPITGVQIPLWATHAVIRVDTTVRFVSGEAYGVFQSFLGPAGQYDDTTLFGDQLIDSTNFSGNYRQPMILPSDGQWAIPASLRGTTAQITSRVKGRTAGGVIGSTPEDYYFADVTFMEKAY